LRYLKQIHDNTRVVGPNSETIKIDQRKTGTTILKLLEPEPEPEPVA
jgi:hypothetical protein